MRYIFTFFTLLICFVSTAQSYTISNSGKNFIKENESCELTAYWDSNGYSIGWGHHGKDVYKGMKISKRQAEKFFVNDIAITEESVKKLLGALPYKYQFSQGFYDGVCDLVYNCGEGAVRNSEFYKRLKKCRVRNGVMNKKDLEFTIAAVKQCKVNCTGHKSRRYDTHKMMLD